MSSKLPSLSCNAHCHVIAPDKWSANDPVRALSDVATPQELLFALNDALGFDRCVIVQSKRHGTDNKPVEDAIAARPDLCRGIALVDVDVSAAELRRLHRAGFRGVRLNYISPPYFSGDMAELMGLAQRISAFGWHLQVFGSPENGLFEIISELLAGPAPIVIDHLGAIDAGKGLDQPAFSKLRRLLEHDSCWIKLSGIDRITRIGPPYLDAISFAAILARNYPDRVVWGNDWPHVVHPGPIPDDTALTKHVFEIAPSEACRRAMLVDNPARLYGFG